MDWPSCRRADKGRARLHSWSPATRRSVVRIQPGQLISLGYGKFVRSDEVISVESITDERGPGRRSLVRLRGVVEPIVASRADASIVDDLVTPPDEALRMREMRTTLGRVVGGLEGIPAVLQPAIRQETDVDVEALVAEARRVLA